MNTWIESAVIYQVNLRALAARDPRNAVEAAAEDPAGAPHPSPLAYLAAHLDAVADLGATVLYLMPPYPIGRAGRKGIGSPYAIRDFRDVDPEFGTRDQLKALIAAAHARGLRVILDITPNHTARDHVWTQEHPEYYVRDAAGGLFYDFDWSDVAKLDYTRPALRQAMAEVYAFWLGCFGATARSPADGVDGFRLDMAHILNDRGFWDETVPHLRRRHPDRELLFLAESYGAANNRDLFARGINAAYDDDFYKACCLLFAVDDAGESAIHLAPEAAASADFAPTLDAFRAGGTAGAFAAVLTQHEARYPAGGGPWLARYTDNHDEGRGLYRFGPGATRALNALLFLSGHCLPFLLTGQEFGALNRPSIHARCAPCDKGRRIVAANGAVRREEGVEFEGSVFARTAAERSQWRTFYRELIALRTGRPELRLGSFALLDAAEEAAPAERTVLAFERRLGARAVRCAVNLGPQARRLGQAQRLDGRPLYGAGALADGWLAPFAAVAVSA